jgi:type I restriction enzyme M protein
MHPTPASDPHAAVGSAVKEIEEKDFDLSINRYKEAKHEEVLFDPPKKIIATLRRIEADISNELKALEDLIR